jgi:hypothetical protein
VAPQEFQTLLDSRQSKSCFPALDMPLSCFSCSCRCCCSYFFGDLVQQQIFEQQGSGLGQVTLTGLGQVTLTNKAQTRGI